MRARIAGLAEGLGARIGGASADAVELDTGRHPSQLQKGEEEWLVKLFLVTCVARADLVLRGLADIRARADTDGVLGACRVDEEDRGL